MRFFGPINLMSGTPSAESANISDLATLECFISPTMAVDNDLKLSLNFLIVKTSSNPWVGWAWWPSPAFIMCTFGPTCLAIFSGIPG